MDKLDTIFEMQQALDEDITTRRHLTHITAEEWIQKDVLAIIAELGELLNEVNFKWWKNPKEIQTAALHEEMVDVLHFFVSMCIRAGMDADTLYRIYMDKNKENFNRQHGLSSKPGYAVED
ncbi:dUTPase [Christensenellaceae bacterium OttesenSCG-928-L17]|nr:dUTPase [Christensenellaceae bacterium OttesenSCG-928-L17]